MAGRCGCSGASSCSCLIRGGGGVSVTGAGTAASPYVISSASGLQVQDSSTIDMSLMGDGSQGSPWVVRGDLTAGLQDLTDVDLSNSTTGYVLARQADGTYDLVPPATVAPGAINVGNGITGNGSSGNPLRIQLAANSGLSLTSAGLAVAGSGTWLAYTPTMYRTSGGTVNIGNSTIRGKYLKDRRTCHIGIELIVGSTFVVGSGLYQFSLPTPSLTTRQQVLPMHVVLGGQNSEIIGTAKLEGDGRVTRMYAQRGSETGRVGSVFPNWTVGTRLIISGTYETNS